MRIPRNVGGVDRAIRVIVGAMLLLLLLPLAFVGPESPWALFGLCGLPLLLSGIFGYCPPYEWLGINTAKRCSPDGLGDYCRS